MLFECRMSNKEFRRLKFCGANSYFFIQHSLFDILRSCPVTEPPLLLGDSSASRGGRVGSSLVGRRHRAHPPVTSPLFRGEVGL